MRRVYIIILSRPATTTKWLIAMARSFGIGTCVPCPFLAQIHCNNYLIIIPFGLHPTAVIETCSVHNVHWHKDRTNDVTNATPRHPLIMIIIDHITGTVNPFNIKGISNRILPQTLMPSISFRNSFEDEERQRKREWWREAWKMHNQSNQ